MSLAYHLLDWHHEDCNHFDPPHIKHLINSHKVISFDIFDTLLVRPYVNPSDLWKHLEWSEKAEGFFDARIKALEVAVRKANGEITFDEIYSQMDPKYKHMRDKELFFERSVLQVNEEMLGIYNYALKRGKRIIIVSDMYLPRTYLEELLREKGYHGFARIYVSNEYRQMKAGGLFREVLRAERVFPSRMLHIGDNVHADVNGAKKFGIHSVRYTKLIDQLLSTNRRAQVFYRNHSDNLSASILLGVLACSRSKKDYWENVGVSYAGPAILGFAKWIDRKLLKDGIREVLFVARDGYTVQRVFNIIRTEPILEHYFYAPRKNSIIINFDYKYHHNTGSSIILDYYRNRTQYLKDNTPSAEATSEGIKFLEQNMQLYAGLIEQDKEDYKRYLQQFHIQNKHLAVIDGFSASASAQRMLTRVLPHHTVDGYYFFKMDGYDSPDLRFDSYHTDKKQTIRNFLIWEFLMTAPSPPANRIEKGVVIFNNITSEEATIIELYPSICRGAEMYAKQAHAFFGTLDFPLSDAVIIDWINLFCDNPTDEDKTHFSQVKIGWHLEHLKYEYVMYNWY